MARLTYAERRAGLIALIVGTLFGISITLGFFGVVWLPYSAIGLLIVLGLRFFVSEGRRLDFERWFVGVSGESQVRQALRELEPLGYVVIDDVDKGRGNVDHVVIGPTGVFAIETKNCGGRVLIAQGRLRDDRDARHARQAIHGAMWVRDRAGVRFVEALLVYPTAKVQDDVIRLRNVTILSLARLDAEITSQSRSLAPDEIERVTQALSAAGSNVRS